MSPDHPGLVLGVDAGNSKTVAVVADLEGRVLGYGRTGNGDIYGASTEDAAVRAVVSAADTAMTMAYGVADHRRLGHAAFCLAGLDWSSDHTFWSDRLDQRYPGLSRRLHNDGFALLRAGEPSGIGVAVSVGTGGAVVARGPEREWTASFWIVDGMGGSCLGQEAYAAVVRAELGIAATTRLTARVLQHFGYPDVPTMLEESTRRHGRRLRYASLARDVLDAARSGDDVARAIVAEQASALARYARAAAVAAGLDPDRGDFTVVLGGSVLSSDNAVLREVTTTHLVELVPRARPRLAPVSPVVGAVAEAIAELTGEDVTDTLATLAGHRFPADFLLT